MHSRRGLKLTISDIGCSDVQNSANFTIQHDIVFDNSNHVLMCCDVVMRMTWQARYLINRPSSPAGLFSSTAIPATKSEPVFYLHSSLLRLSKLWDGNFTFNCLKQIRFLSQWFENLLEQGTHRKRALVLRAFPISTSDTLVPRTKWKFNYWIPAHVTDTRSSLGGKEPQYLG